MVLKNCRCRCLQGRIKSILIQDISDQLQEENLGKILNKISIKMFTFKKLHYLI